MTIREKYEWAQIWWEEADSNSLERILLIGDSITLGYKQFVQEALKGKYYVDMLATSKSIDDPSYIRELNYILNEYPYKLIHYNNGLHGWHVKADDYETSYKCVINMLLTKCNNIVLTTSTPVTKVEDNTQIDTEKDEVLKERNCVVQKLAKEFNFKVDDLYEDMLGKSEYRVDDGYHYDETGKKVQGDIVANKILNILGK